MKKFDSALPALGWRCIWLNLLMLGLVAVLTSLKLGGSDTMSGFSRVLTSLFLLIGWLTAIRFISLDTWARNFWLILLASNLLVLFFWGNGGLVMAIGGSTLFLVTRSLRTWRHISARRRALGFGFGIVALVILFGSTGVWSTDTDSALLSVMDKLGIWSLASLLIFWTLSLFHLAVRMRLHFLRLRAKLAVSGFLTGLVPLVLMLILGLLIFYLGMGGARAMRTGNILESWRTLAARGNDLAGAPFDTTFTWPAASSHQGDFFIPPALPGLVEAVRQDPDFQAVADTTNWFLIGHQIWLVRWENPGQEGVRAHGWLLNRKPLQYLSSLVRAGVEMTGLKAFMAGSKIKVTASESGEPMFRGVRASYRDVSGDSTFWNPWRSFGISVFDVFKVGNEGLEISHLLLNLGVGWADLKAEFLEGDNNFNVAMVVLVVLVAVLFLIIEIFALFFGIRITEGFVSAVHALRRGTKALAAGDLDTTIDIPNEDEFGDLAQGFNEMTLAIRQGREDALANARLIRELETARAIQERLLPSEEPVLPGFEITGASIPSREIGGDYFDFIVRGQDEIGVAIGDVSGKGMPAALLMSNLQASLHGQVIHPSSVAEVVGRVNDLIVASTDPHMFATFFYGLLDVRQGTFTSCNAGHNPPLLLKADGTLETLKAGGLLLGMLAGQTYRQETVALEPGEVVVLYTDGITEAVGPTADEDDFDAMFGEQALEDVLRANSHLPALGIKEAILGAVARHTEGVAQSDDITLVVIRRQG